MKIRLSNLLVSTAVALAGSAYAANVTGAGATFPQPIYAAWAEAYKATTGNEANYQGIGSSGGVKQISAGTVDFGASDEALKPEVLAEKALVQFPTVIGAVSTHQIPQGESPKNRTPTEIKKPPPRRSNIQPI